MLETERLVLRRPEPGDAAAALEYLADPLATEFIGGVARGIADAETAVERWIARWRANGFGQFIVLRREDGRHLGRVGLLVWDERSWETSSLAEGGPDARVELGWALARAHWGHGYATEAARSVRAWARAERGVESLISLIHPDNARSKRVAEKLGALPTATVDLDSGPAVVWQHPQRQPAPILQAEPNTR